MTLKLFTKSFGFSKQISKQVILFKTSLNVRMDSAPNYNRPALHNVDFDRQTLYQLGHMEL